jgi:MYXO-CTERM domain-containing protein
VGLTGPFNVGGLATPGSGMVSAMISISRSVTLLINLVGTEVSRTFDAPEPSPPVLELTALLSVLGAGWWHRRRAR